METCVFCDIVAGTAAAHRIAEDDLTIAFMDILPATRGHALVVPKAHRRDLLDATPDELAAVMASVRRVAQAAMDTLGADGFNVVHATGDAAFQTVYHLHFHVVPRFAGDEVVIFARPGLPEEIAKAAGALRGSLVA